MFTSKATIAMQLIRNKMLNSDYCFAVDWVGPSCFTLHCSSSLSCIHEYLAIIDSGGYVYERSLRALIAAYDWMPPREAEMVSE